MERIELPQGDSSGELERGSLTFIGNATVLLRYAGLTLLTDPNFLHAGDRASLAYGLLHTRRRVEPSLDLQELPPIDLVLLSHHHEDHFDRRVVHELDHHLPIVTTPEASRVLARKGFKSVYALRAWEQVEVVKGERHLKLTAMPGRHGPPLVWRLLPQVMGSLLEFEGPDGTVSLRLYISGDTLVHRTMRRIPERHPDIDLGLLHLGGTRIFGLLVTMDARQGVEAIRIVKPHVTVPIHYDDYDIFTSSIEDFQKAVREAGLEDRVKYLLHGETLEFEVPAGGRWRPVGMPRVESPEERPPL